MNRRVLIAAAVGGLVLNPAVAWAFALLTDVSRSQVSEVYAELDGETHWEVYRWESMAGTRILSRCWSGIAPGPYNHGDPNDQLSGWGRIEEPVTPLPRALSEVDEGWGLPMRSMGCRFSVRSTDDGRDSHNSGVLSIRKSAAAGERGYYLPVIPLWPGFALNTIVYAMVIFAAHGAVRDLRLYCAACRIRSSPTKAMTST